MDWLIPGDSYTVSGQTPIEVIADLAKAAGAYVESHPYEAQLFVRPIWRQSAWGRPTPALTIPANLILSVSGQRRISERCNAVRLTPAAEQIGGAKAKGGLVYREGTDQQPEASTLTHAAYTDTDVMRAAGIHALSETGTHNCRGRKNTSCRWRASARYGHLPRPDRPGRASSRAYRWRWIWTAARRWLRRPSPLIAIWEIKP